MSSPGPTNTDKATAKPAEEITDKLTEEAPATDSPAPETPVRRKSLEKPVEQPVEKPADKTPSTSTSPTPNEERQRAASEPPAGDTGTISGFIQSICSKLPKGSSSSCPRCGAEGALGDCKLCGWNGGFGDLS